MTTAAAAAPVTRSAGSEPPWRPAGALPDEALARIRRRAIFDYCKWDPQMEDVPAIAPRPLVLPAAAWRELASLAESLARETLAAETELLHRPELHRMLALPRAVRSALARAASHPSAGIARLIRFDFHHTAAGWRISEANSDVPGGMNEASGLAALFASYVDGAEPAGDTSGEYARALLGGLPPGAHVALVHATAYTDDRQVMTYIARRLETLGARTSLVSPGHLRWREGIASVDAPCATGRADVLVRFYPGEWLPSLPGECGWSAFFHHGRTPVSNPATALLTQSKRWPLLWDALHTPLPTWRALLPETRDPRDAPWRTDEGWVLKPALGRVGEGIGMPGVTGRTEWKRLTSDVRWHPRHWVAQRRFVPTPLISEDGPGAPEYPCIGVYTVDGRAAGAYGRLARRQLIDWRAQDVAVLVERTASPEWTSA